MKNKSVFMKASYYRYIILAMAAGYFTNCLAQCEPWCQGWGGSYAAYNAYPHSLWWHRHQKQRIYKEASIGQYSEKNISDNIVAIQTPPNIESDIQYYYGNGTFYVDYDGGYIVVPAPIGYTVPSIPANSSRIKYKNTVYDYYGGTFFVRSPYNYYITVKAPLGISIPELPRNSIIMNDGNGNIVYRQGNTYYQPHYWYGNIWYQVVGN